MPKRGLSRGVQDLFEKRIVIAAKYRWEFLRRNEKYCRFWRAGLKAKKKPEEWDERFNPDLTYDQLIKELTRRSAPSDDQLSDLIGGSIDSIPKKSKLELRKAMAKNIKIHFMHALACPGVRYEWDKNSQELTIKIKLNLIKSRSALRKFIGLIVEEQYKMHSPESFAVSLVGRERVRWRTPRLARSFDEILDAGDMKRAGKNWQQIRKKVFPKDTDDQSTKSKISQLNAEYKRLVNGAYKEISFP